LEGLQETQPLVPVQDKIDPPSPSSILCEWFEGAPESTEVYEEAVGLGTYRRILTLLSFSELPTSEELEEASRRRADRELDWRDALRTFELD
jgi:hypothetical protein